MQITWPLILISLVGLLYLFAIGIIMTRFIYTRALNRRAEPLRLEVTIVGGLKAD